MGRNYAIYFKNGYFSIMKIFVGSAVVMVGQPMDTIKVKMQTFGHLYSGVAMCVRETWRNEGLRKGNISLLYHD